MKRRVLVAAALAALAAPAAASAHANLVRTEPADAAVLARGPAEFRAVFDDVVQVGPGIAAVRNDTGTSILKGTPHVVGERTLVIPLARGLADGAYSVRWAIVSDDGHLESGVVAFAVGLGRPPPTAALAAEASGPQAGNVTARWLFLAGVLAAVGVALFGLVARPHDEERVALVLSGASVAAALGAAQEVHRIGLDTRAGKALGAAFLLAVVVASLAGAATLERRVLRPALVLALGLAVVPAFVGHALDRGVNRVNVPVDVLHVLGAAAWVGALIALVLLRDAPPRRAIQLAAGGVALVAVTGVVRACFELLHVSQLWDTSYGQTLLVKTALLLVALAVGWLLRAHIRRRATVELVFVAGIVVAVAVLVLLRPGRNVEAAPAPRVQATEPAPPPPAPPRGAVVSAKEFGPLGVALATEPQGSTALVLSPAGGGLSGLTVRMDGRTASPCGSGCYRSDEAPGRSVDVTIDGFGRTLEGSFDVPADARPAAALLGRATRRYEALDSATFVEHLASNPSTALTSLWRVERPDRVSYVIPGGAQGIVIGKRRWDRSSPDGEWQSSAQTPLTQPTVPWNEVTNVHEIGERGDTKTLTFVDPETPAYYEVDFSATTLLPRIVHMTAAAHFMTDRYVSFNAPREIVPPR